jgi:hypothetical protein
VLWICGRRKVWKLLDIVGIIIGIVLDEHRRQITMKRKMWKDGKWKIVFRFINLLGLVKNRFKFYKNCLKLICYHVETLEVQK